jgi:hypothetical protein
MEDIGTTGRTIWGFLKNVDPNLVKKQGQILANKFDSIFKMEVTSTKPFKMSINRKTLKAIVASEEYIHHVANYAPVYVLIQFIKNIERALEEDDSGESA